MVESSYINNVFDKGGVLLLITRETDYALRLLRSLATKSQITVGTLAQEAVVPLQFAYKILKKLSKAGVVSLTRGVDGGCKLKADLETITLYNLVEIMGGVENINACITPGYNCTWQNNCSKQCLIHQKLKSIQQAVNSELDSHTLATILMEPKENSATV